MVMSWQMMSLTLTTVPLVDVGNKTVSVLLISDNWIGIPLHERIRIHILYSKLTVLLEYLTALLEIINL